MMLPFNCQTWWTTDDGTLVRCERATDHGTATHCNYSHQPPTILTYTEVELTATEILAEHSPTHFPLDEQSRSN